MRRASKNLRVAKLAVGSALGVLALSSAAYAQDGGAVPAADADAPPEAIVVTGSRVMRDGTQAPTPVTVVGSDLLEQRASTNVADTLNELPAFRPLVTPATQQAVGGNVGARVLDLRGLGGERTLVLLDGKRFVPSTQKGTVDINLIPTALDPAGGNRHRRRVRCLRFGCGGRCGQFHSGQGLRRSARQPRNTASRKRATTTNYFASLAWGTSFASGRGHFMIAGEYSDNKGMGDCYSRDWCPARNGHVRRRCRRCRSPSGVDPHKPGC